jgi:hypothetical protein
MGFGWIAPACLESSVGLPGLLIVVPRVDPRAVTTVLVGEADQGWVLSSPSPPTTSTNPPLRASRLLDCIVSSSYGIAVKIKGASMSGLGTRAGCARGQIELCSAGSGFTTPFFAGPHYWASRHAR